MIGIKLLRRTLKSQPWPIQSLQGIAIRGMIGSDEHVVFRNEKLKKYIIYINGRFACEQKMEVPIDFQKLTVDKKKR